MTDETEFLDDFLLEAREIMDKLDLDFVQLEKLPDDEKLLGNIFRGMHTLKGSSGFFSFKRLELVSHAGESLLSKLRDKSLVLTSDMVTILLRTLDSLRIIIDHIESTRSESAGDDRLLLENLRSLAQLALILACFSYAVAAIWARSKLTGVNPIMAATGMLTSASLIMIPLAILVDGPPNFRLETITILSMIFLSLPATAIAYLLYYKALNLAGSANLSLVTLLVPPMAVIWGAIFLEEKLMPTAYLGFLFITIGMCFIDGRLFNSKKR